ncbi:hypothetical protein AAG614_10790 [Citromicrobium bathyomarinum]|jgi:hypothetical protein|uniref:hypothetical protein n=2 Tax=Alphaproteobacteria TaxID=28211 RepID=UPI001CFEA9D6|nr:MULTISPECIES: hypothetical protein [Sphingomonadales]
MSRCQSVRKRGAAAGLQAGLSPIIEDIPTGADMSYDQKPSRIKLVSTGGSARAPQNAPTDTQPLQQAIEEAQRPEVEVAPARRFSILSAILFLAGCAVGGAGLVAWPHLVG